MDDDSEFRTALAEVNDQLLAEGLIESTGTFRNGKLVYRITEKGIAQAAANRAAGE